MRREREEAKRAEWKAAEARKQDARRLAGTALIQCCSLCGVCCVCALGMRAGFFVLYLGQHAACEIGWVRSV